MEKFPVTSKYHSLECFEHTITKTIEGMSKEKEPRKTPRVLVVEYNTDIHIFLLELLSGKVDLVLTETIEFAEKVISRLDEPFDVIVIDACVPDEVNVITLMQKLCYKYFCPKIALSNYDKNSNHVIMAGCTHKCEKKELPNVLRKMFGLL